MTSIVYDEQRVVEIVCFHESGDCQDDIEFRIITFLQSAYRHVVVESLLKNFLQQAHLLLSARYRILS